MHNSLFVQSGKEIVFNESEWNRVWGILKKIQELEHEHEFEIELKKGVFGMEYKSPFMVMVEAHNRREKYRTAWEKKQVEQ